MEFSFAFSQFCYSFNHFLTIIFPLALFKAAISRKMHKNVINSLPFGWHILWALFNYSLCIWCSIKSRVSLRRKNWTTQNGRTHFSAVSRCSSMISKFHLGLTVDQLCQELKMHKMKLNNSYRSSALCIVDFLSLGKILGNDN